MGFFSLPAVQTKALKSRSVLCQQGSGQILPWPLQNRGRILPRYSYFGFLRYCQCSSSSYITFPGRFLWAETFEVGSTLSTLDSCTGLLQPGIPGPYQGDFVCCFSAARLGRVTKLSWNCMYKRGFWGLIWPSLPLVWLLYIISQQTCLMWKVYGAGASSEV